MPRAVSATIVGEFLVALGRASVTISSIRARSSDTTGVFAGIVIAITLVLLINVVVNAIERRALRWRPVDREMELVTDEARELCGERQGRATGW